MLFHLFYHLTDGAPYAYKSAWFRAIVAILLAFGLVWAFAPTLIRWLIKQKVGDLPEFDNKSLNELTAGKANTPTMGGLAILLAIAVTTLLLADLSSFLVLLGLVVMVWLGAVGAVDDWLKLTQKRRGGSRDGLKSAEKLLFQVGLSVLVAAFLIRTSGGEWGTAYNLIFYKHPVDLHVLLGAGDGWLAALGHLTATLAFGLVVTLVITGSSNAVNLTDGMDGLAAGCVAIVSLCFLLLAFLVGSGLGADPTDRAVWSQWLGIPGVEGAGELAVLCGAMTGACLGFLWFNANPAQVFMGDTGSLALGGLIGYVAVATRHELILLIVGLVFVMEAVSVMLQVGWFKYTRLRYGEGRRLFRIAPIHHHFHLGGWSEPQVVTRFWLITLLCCAFALATLKLR